MSALDVHLDMPLPETLPVGQATAVFVIGTCVPAGGATERLEVLVNGVAHEPIAFAMPRHDRYDPAVSHSYRSGFWATVPVPPRSEPGAVEIDVRVMLAGGGEERASLGRIEVVDAATGDAEARAETIAVCMATYEPDRELFRAQVDSLRAQTDEDWVCVISDDCSSAESFAFVEEVIAGDPRFAASRSPDRLGFYRNFERALGMAPPAAALVALCDQDDRWHPGKLATLRASIGHATLVYSDQRLVNRDGRVLRETMWEGRRNNHTSLTSMLVANSITGAAALMRRDVAELALPFPPTPGIQFHDHWIALVALAAGEVAYVDRPLYDYVQHRGAVFSEVSSSRSKVELRLPRPRATLAGWRAAYFHGYLVRVVQARVLLERCRRLLTPAKRRELERFAAAERSPVAFAWLLARPLRALAGRNETLGSETELAAGIVWSRLARLLAAGARGPRRGVLDAAAPPPLDFGQKRLRRWRSRV